MAYEPQHRAQRLIGDVPKHRAGGLKPTQKAIYHLSKPAAAFDEVSNAPMTRRALARQSTTKITGALTHAGLMVALGKAANDGDPFEIAKAKHRGLGPVATKAAKVDSKVRARLVPAKGAHKRPPVGAALREGVAGSHFRGTQAMDDALGFAAPVSPRQATWNMLSDVGGHLAHHVIKSKVPGRIIRQMPKAGDSIDQRLRVNYSQWRSKIHYEGRNVAGNQGRLKKIQGKMGPRTRGDHYREKSILTNDPKRIAASQEAKKYADAQVQGIMNLNRRRPDRHLP